MKILHYLFGLPPVRTGGLPKYALDLMQEQKKMGHEILMIIPGPFKGKEIDNVSIREWNAWNGIPCYRIINPIYIPNAYGINIPEAFMPKVSGTVYKEWLKQIKPDVIHVHSLLGIHQEFFCAAKEEKIPMIYTTHDYYGLCPKIGFLKEGQNCKSQDWGECVGCCQNAYGLKRLRLEHSDIYRKYCESKYLMSIVHGNILKQLKQRLKLSGKNGTDAREIQEDVNVVISEVQKYEYRKLQQYYLDIFNMIDYYHFNSEQTKEIYEYILGKKNGQVVPVMNKEISDCRQKKNYGKTLRIGYLGNQMLMKGYDYLIQELENVYMSGRKDFYLNTYLVENNYQRPYIRNHKPFPAGQQEEIYKEMDVLVVPSLWKETFGMVVLEALSYGVPVLVSEHVGAKMLVNMYEGCGKEFSIKKGKLTQIIKEIYDKREILVEMNTCILKSDMVFEYKKHVGIITDMYQNSNGPAEE